MGELRFIAWNSNNIQIRKSSKFKDRIGWTMWGIFDIGTDLEEQDENNLDLLDTREEWPISLPIIGYWNPQTDGLSGIHLGGVGYVLAPRQGWILQHSKLFKENILNSFIENITENEIIKRLKGRSNVISTK